MGRQELVGKIRAEGRQTKKELKAQVQSSSFWYVALNTAALIAFYYLTSIGLTFYQSWLMKELKFPLTIVLSHFIMKFCLAAGCRTAYTLHTGLQRVSLGWNLMIGRVGMVAIVASLDIALSQWSFEYIDVALYTITKSTSIVFILMWAILLKLEQKHWSLIVIVLMISTGLAMFTYKSTDFVLIGFIMVLSASFLSGIRWTVSQLIMQRAQYNLKNPIDMVYHVQPMMIIALLPFAIGFESTRVATSISLMRFASLSSFIQTVCLVSVGGFIAFLMECAEFLLVSYTSGLTLSVAGIVKEIISLTLAVIFQSSDISVINMLGLVICMTGITLHVVRKAASVETRGSSMERSSRRGSRGSPGQKESLLSQSESDEDSEVEVFHTSRSGRAATPPEEPFMQDHRQWTGVRDSHIAAASKPPDFSTHVDEEDIEVTTGDILDLASDDEGGDALDEADQLLEQLDLLSSD